MEQLADYYEPEAKKRIKLFLQIMNNKKTTYNRLRILGYQYSLLQNDLETPEVDLMMGRHIFKREGRE